MSKMRLQKFIAQSGIASRRNAEEMIAAGRVSVNDTVITRQGITVDPKKDVIRIDGRTIHTPSASQTILLHKPRGYICSVSAVQGRTVYDLLKNVSERIVPAGRLDKNSEGLLIMSNDGDLVNIITHPKYGCAKIYKVTVSGLINPGKLEKLRSRLIIDGHRIEPVAVKLLKSSPDQSKHQIEFRLQEGRNRQIRKMCELVNLRITRLVRTGIGSLRIQNLKPGQWRPLSESEVNQFKTPQQDQLTITISPL